MHPVGRGGRRDAACLSHAGSVSHPGILEAAVSSLPGSGKPEITKETHRLRPYISAMATRDHALTDKGGGKSKHRPAKNFMIHWNLTILIAVFVLIKIVYVPLRVMRIHECSNGTLSCMPRLLPLQGWAEAFVVIWVVVGLVVLLARKSWVRALVLFYSCPRSGSQAMVSKGSHRWRSSLGRTAGIKRVRIIPTAWGALGLNQGRILILSE